MITVYTRKGGNGYLPAISTDSDQEAKAIIEAYINSGFQIASHLIHDDGNEDWFITD